MNKAQQPKNQTTRAVNEVWSLAWPTILTMTSFTIMQFVDKLMISRVGVLEVAAQGNAGTWAFAIIATILGVVTVVNTYVSQHLGAGSPQEAAKYAWSAGWMAAFFWLVIVVPWAILIPRVFQHIHSGHPELVSLETEYAVFTLAGSLFLLIGRGFSQYFFGMHRPKIITVSAVIANVVNVVANYILIFGEDGITNLSLFGVQLDLPGIPGSPALGLKGAAIATVIGMFMEMLIPFIIFVGPSFNTKYFTRKAWRPCLNTMRALFRIGWPGSIQWGNEIICWALFMTVFVGGFGPDHMAAGWVALGYLHLSFMPAIGINVAVNSIVGKYIGAGTPDIAVSRARIGVTMAAVYMSVCAAIFIVFRYELMQAFFSINLESILTFSGTIDDWLANLAQIKQNILIVKLGSTMLIMVAIFQTVDALGIVYTGALRGAGDTVWPGVVTAIYSWVLIVGGGWLAVTFFPGLGSIGPWIAAAAYVILIGITMAIRFERGGWRSIDLLGKNTSGEPRLSSRDGA